MIHVSNIRQMAVLILLTAITLSVVAAYYSIIGLIAIFAAAAIPVAIMGSTLEVAKLVTASWLYNYWERIPKFLKVYLSLAVVVLMFVTSMGIFGFLSKAHLDQGIPTGDISAKVSLLDERIKTQKDNVDTARKALLQMDAQVDQRLSRSDDEKGAERAVQIRRQQAPERNKLQNEIGAAQKEIAKLNEERAPVATQLRKVEAEVGPIKYIAKFIYGDKIDENILERAVTWVIILLILVFDPLAVLLIIAGNMTWNWANQQKKIVVEVVKEKEEILDTPIVPEQTLDEINEQVKETKIELTEELPATEIPVPEIVTTEVVASETSEQQPVDKLDKIYKASAENLAKQNRGRGWFQVVFPTRKK